MWSEQQLALGKPICMSTETLIEWIQRQLETPEETEARHRVIFPEQDDEVTIFSDIGPIITIKNGVMTPNEARDIKTEFLLQKDNMGRYIGWSESINVVPAEFDYVKH